MTDKNKLARIIRMGGFDSRNTIEIYDEDNMILTTIHLIKGRPSYISARDYSDIKNGVKVIYRKSLLEKRK